MTYLGNTPVPANTVIQLEARKSFSFALRFVDANDRQLDITGCTLTLVVKSQPQDAADVDDSDNLISNATAELVLPVRGFAMFNLQASDLHHPVGEYPYAIVLRSPAGYSTVVVKGVLEIVANTEFASVLADYDGANTPVSLEVTMRGEHAVDVRIGSILPPGMNYLTDAERVLIEIATAPAGGTIGQALVKASSADHDLKWEDVGSGGAGLPATGVPAGRVPMATGTDTWNWAALPTSAMQLQSASLNLDTMKTSGAFAWNDNAYATLSNNFPVEALAGTLEVQALASQGIAYQRFTTLDTQRVFIRRFWAPVWTAWTEVSKVGHVHAAADITSGVLNKARVPGVIALNGISYGTAAAPTGQPDGTLYIKYTA